MQTRCEPATVYGLEEYAEVHMVSTLSLADIVFLSSESELLYLNTFSA